MIVAPLMAHRHAPPLEQVLGSAATIDTSRIEGDGPDGRLPLTAEMLRTEPSGNIFGLTQNAGMGWRPDALGGPQYVIVSTMGGVGSEQGEPIALGYHTGHWEIGLLVRSAAEALRAAGAIPFAVYCSTAARERRHLGRLCLRCRPDRGGAGRCSGRAARARGVVMNRAAR